MAINDAAIRRPLSIVGDIRGARLGQDGSGDARRQSERELWRQFELARPRILGALLDLGYAQFGLDRVPRMADSALCDGVRNGPLVSGTFGRAYEANRRAAIEGIVDADPVAALVRQIMAQRSSWTGSAVDLLRVGGSGGSDGAARDSTGWPKNPRALAGRLRRAQTFLRALGIEITFSREGRAGNRVIRMRATSENTVSTVGGVSEYEPWSGQPRLRPAGGFCDDNARPDLVGPPLVGQVSVTADGADGADANAPPIPDLCRRPRRQGAI